MYLWYFWAAAVGMVLALAALFVQSLRHTPKPAAGPADLRVYRDQLAEIERDVSRGTLPATEAERLRLEVSRRLLDADRKATQGVTNADRFPRSAALAVLILLFGAIWLYTRLGTPNYPDLPLKERLAMADDAYRNRPSQAEAEASARAEGYAQMHLTVHPSNEQAVRFYERSGWVRSSPDGEPWTGQMVKPLT